MVHNIYLIRKPASIRPDAKTPVKSHPAHVGPPTPIPPTDPGHSELAPNDPLDQFGDFADDWSHLLNVAVHANQLPSKPHKDGLSSHLGYDGICAVGPFEYAWLCFPHLGIRIKVRKLDVVLLWGTALFHHMYWWKGQGRFVIVPFADRHLFPVFRVRRPKKMSLVFGDKWADFRASYPSKPLNTFL